MQSRNTKKLFTFFSLYIAQSIPMSFFSTVIPVMMRQENFTLSAIGLLQLIKLPWILKFLWSPLIDSTSTSLSSYKRWIFSSEMIYAILILAVSFLNFRINFYLIVALIILSFIASATQDIATDALAILSFDNKNKSMLNSMQSMGSFGGALIGSGLLLLLFRSIGWSILLPVLALFVLAALLPLVIYKGEDIDKERIQKKARAIDLVRFFRQKGIAVQLFFLFTYYSGMIGILAMVRPYLVDLGYDMKQIGVISGIWGTLTGFCCAFAGGVMMRRIGLKRARHIFAAMMVMTGIFFYYISLQKAPPTALLYAAVMMLWGTYGMSAVALNTTAMEFVRPGCEGTDFTIQTVFAHLGGIIMAIISGRIADRFGYSGLFIFETILSFISLIFITFVINYRDLKDLSLNKQ